MVYNSPSSYETSNGIRADEAGYLKNPGSQIEAQVRFLLRTFARCLPQTDLMCCLLSRARYNFAINSPCRSCKARTRTPDPMACSTPSPTLPTRTVSVPKALTFPPHRLSVLLLLPDPADSSNNRYTTVEY